LIFIMHQHPMAIKFLFFLKRVACNTGSTALISAPETSSNLNSSPYPRTNKIPAIVDSQPVDGGAPVSVFESGAILQYLAEKTGKFLSKELRERTSTLEWLYWQVAGFGPMLGQNHHFTHYAPQPVPYAIERFLQETRRLYGVLNRQLEKNAYIAGDHYSIADIATYPWVVAHERQRVDLAEYPAVRNWFERVKARPATQKAYALASVQ
jgi:GST-like protein